MYILPWKARKSIFLWIKRLKIQSVIQRVIPKKNRKRLRPLPGDVGIITVTVSNKIIDV